MPNSLVKFANRVDGNGRGKVYWGRAGEDGLPFRGPAAPTFTDEEFESRTVRVADPKNGTFDTSNPQQNKVYLEVLDGIANDWYKCLFIRRWRSKGSQKIMVYIEWLEYFLEDGARSPVSHGQPMELSHGSTHGQYPSIPGP